MLHCPAAMAVGEETSEGTGKPRALDETRAASPLHDPNATVAPVDGQQWQQPALGATVAPGQVISDASVGPRTQPVAIERTLTLMDQRGHAVMAPRTDLAVTRDSLARTGPVREGPVRPGMPERLGRYIVIKELGAGGMGVVYKAFDPDLDRKVALKLLLGQATSQARTRLLREAQAMAKLSHPNVVPVFDVGVVDGQVFVAMDFVDGTTLSGWMESRHPWQEVVDLFVQAGRGLAAAHTVGLIHRDFKPDNVLLRRDPGTGELRAQVADFGLARRDDDGPEALASVESAAVLQSRHSLLDQGLTRVGAVIGTPTYMSPEQHEGAPVDPRTDQFSYCVALWEALYGDRPFTGDTLEELATAASGPRPPPPDRRVPGWLYRLCLRGLQPAREARFADMEALLLEVSRRRAQGRHRWFAGASGVAMVGALAAVLVTRGEPAEQRCAGGPARLAGVWDEAVQEQARQAFTATGVVYAADAWKTAKAQVDRFGDAWLAMYRDSCEATGRGEQSAELMDLRTGCLGRALQDLGALTRLYVAADKQVVKQAVDIALALPALDACADMAALRAVGDAPSPEQASQVEAVRETLAQARSLEAAGKYKEAVTLASGAVEAATALGYLPLTAEAKLVLGISKMRAGEHEAAIPVLTAAVASALAGRDDARVLSGLLNLEEVIGYSLGRDKEAAVWAELADGALLRTGSKPRDELRRISTRALVDIAAGRFAEAETALLRQLELLEAEYGPDDPRLGGAINALGGVYLRTGRYVEAETLLVRAVELAEAAGGSLHPDVAFPLNNLALSHERQGRRLDAVAALRRAKTIIERTSGPDHPNVGVLLQNIGGMLRLAGKLAEARVELDASRTLLEAKLGLEHPALAGVYSFSGDVAIDQGDLVRARADFQHADDLRRKALGAEHPDRGLTLLGLGKVALAEGKPEAAVASLEQALAVWKATTPDPQDIGEVRWNLARALWTTDNPRARVLIAEAQAHFVEAGINSKGLLQETEAWLARHPAK